jgi:3-oxoacyl-[acyl-carrier protein] reductase
VDLGLSGRVAIVTGASRGLGRACAIALAREGAHLVIAARREGPLADLDHELAKAGAKIRSLAIDVTSPDAPASLVEAALEAFGRIDVVVANSGGPPAARAFEVDDDAVLAAIQSNLLTHVRLAQAALPHLTASGWGRICSIASYAVVQPIPTLALSNLARSGLRAWAKTAAQDLVGTGVTLNLACPGLHLTDRIRALGGLGEGPIGDPSDFGKVVAFLCSEPAGFINGATIIVDGGATVAL